MTTQLSQFALSRVLLAMQEMTTEDQDKVIANKAVLPALAGMMWKDLAGKDRQFILRGLGR